MPTVPVCFSERFVAYRRKGRSPCPRSTSIKPTRRRTAAALRTVKAASASRGATDRSASTAVAASAPKNALSRTTRALGQMTRRVWLLVLIAFAASCPANQDTLCYSLSDCRGISLSDPCAQCPDLAVPASDPSVDRFLELRGQCGDVPPCDGPQFVFCDNTVCSIGTRDELNADAGPPTESD